MTVAAIPHGYQPVTPYLIVADAAAAIEFYKRVFAATELLRLSDPRGKLAHAEIQIGDSVIMLADEFPEWGNVAPKSGSVPPVRIHLYVEDVDAVVDRAVAAGAKLLIPVSDQFYGDRSGRFEDPFGHYWIVATHTEDVAPAEIQRRFAEFMQQAGGTT